MLIGNRVALACVATLAAVIGTQETLRNPGSELTPALENVYVIATVIPPSRTPPKAIDTCFNSDSLPFVRLYLPAPKANSVGQVANRAVFTGYFVPEEMFGCTPHQDGTTVYLYLRARPFESAFNEDAVKSDAKHNEVLFENERVRVVRIHFEPGESGPMVDKRKRVIFAVTDSHATVTFPDRHSESRDVKAGAVSFADEGRQATKNTGTTPIENIVVELKSKESEKK